MITKYRPGGDNMFNVQPGRLHLTLVGTHSPKMNQRRPIQEGYLHRRVHVRSYMNVSLIVNTGDRLYDHGLVVSRSLKYLRDFVSEEL